MPFLFAYQSPTHEQYSAREHINPLDVTLKIGIFYFLHGLNLFSSIVFNMPLLKIIQI